jgi:hypothetical protein
MPLDALRRSITPIGMHYFLVPFDLPEVDTAAYELVVDGRGAQQPRADARRSGWAHLALRPGSVARRGDPGAPSARRRRCAGCPRMRGCSTTLLRQPLPRALTHARSKQRIDPLVNLRPTAVRCVSRRRSPFSVLSGLEGTYAVSLTGPAIYSIWEVLGTATALAALVRGTSSNMVDSADPASGRAAVLHHRRPHGRPSASAASATLDRRRGSLLVCDGKGDCRVSASSMQSRHFDAALDAERRLREALPNHRRCVA